MHTITSYWILLIRSYDYHQNSNYAAFLYGDSILEKSSSEVLPIGVYRRDFVPDECLSKRSETIELPEYQSLHNSDFHTFLRPHQSSLLSAARHRLQSQTIREVIHEVAPPNLLLREVHSVGLMLIFHPGIHKKSTSYVP